MNTLVVTIIVLVVILIIYLYIFYLCSRTYTRTIDSVQAPIGEHGESLCEANNPLLTKICNVEEKEKDELEKDAKENRMIPVLQKVFCFTEDEARMMWRKWGRNAPHVDFPHECKSLDGISACTCQHHHT